VREKEDIMSISERAAVRRPQQREKRLPRYVAMAKVAGGWQRIGAAWDVRSGDDALSVQITAMPMNWDGRFSLFLPNAPPEDEASIPE
jgi:hypothetical protein